VIYVSDQLRYPKILVTCVSIVPKQNLPITGLKTTAELTTRTLQVLTTSPTKLA
jgi:hypothetical protein